MTMEIPKESIPVTARGLASWPELEKKTEKVAWNDLQRIDSRGMLAAVAGFPDQCRAAAATGQGLFVPPDWRPRNIVFTGMGGSAVGGELAAGLVNSIGPVPAIPVRGYELPPWVGSDTLAVVTSYSGETEETLTAFRQAVGANAMILAVTSGGRLADEAAGLQTRGYPAVLCKIPGGLAPRAALGYLLVPVLVFLGRLGLVRNQEPAITESIELVSTLAQDHGWTRTLALAVHAALEAGAPVVVYGSGNLGQTVAYRWQTQCNENAKALVHHHGFPEMCHNEIMGWEGHPEPSRAAPGAAVAIMLHTGYDHPRNALRADIVAGIISKKAAIFDVTARGDLLLAQVLYLVYAGDWVSTYLALLRGYDPVSIASIELLKQKLAGHH